MRKFQLLVLALIILGTSHSFGIAEELGQAAPKQSKKKKPRKKRKPRPFQWVNPLKNTSLPGVKHATFQSPSMKIDVGYCIYLPSDYQKSGKAKTRYPVVYYLHGGRPGSETKSVSLAKYVHLAIQKKQTPPTVYVFVNGGPVSHYNYPQIKNGLGEDVFTKELIPHIDKTYRTIADRKGRALEGFSQGGRGTARIMFKHPNLFCSAAPGGGGHATEKRISEENGRESANLKFAPGYNTWDLAKIYAKNPTPKFRILVYVGTKGFNYENNLAYMKYLESLKIPFQRLIVKDAPHSGRIIYEKRGLEIMKFHAESFRNQK
jgi:enterochelin esterase-like enzyme